MLGYRGDIIDAYICRWLLHMRAASHRPRLRFASNVLVAFLDEGQLMVAAAS
jgi:hypothetical protein